MKAKNYNVKTDRYTLAKNVIFLFLCICSFSLFSQEFAPTIWVQPDKSLAEQEYIANYPLLDKETDELSQSFKTIATHKSGTLFMVGRFKAEDQWLQYGDVQVFPHFAKAGPLTVTFDTVSIQGKATIFKLSYQISQKYKGKARPFSLADECTLTEVLFFDEILSTKEAREVESYLALKYSVNITQNSKASLQYYAPHKEKVWQYAVDGFYDAEVLGLGQDRSKAYYQTQTYSSDAKSIRLSFTANEQLGEMPQMDLTDQSHLIVSRKKDQSLNDHCLFPAEVYPWKLHFENWSILNPKEVYLWEDSVFAEELTPLLIGAGASYTIERNTVEEGTQLKVSLAKLDYSKDYYILWFGEEGCDPLGSVLVEDCEEQQENTVAIRLNEEALNAQLVLINQQTEERWQFQQFKNNSRISGLPEGQYELTILHEEQSVLQKVFMLKQCSANTTVSFSHTEEESIDANSPFLTIYPNPAGKGREVTLLLNGYERGEVSVQITDAQGRVVHEQAHTIEGGTYSTLSYHFAVAGMYTIRVSNAQFTEVKRVVIQ